MPGRVRLSRSQRGNTLALKSLAYPLRVRVAAPGGVSGAGAAFAGLTSAFAAAVVLSFIVAVETWTPMAMVAIPLLAASALWIAGGAATAMLGLGPAQRRPGIADDWTPTGMTAVLMTLCGEDPQPASHYLSALGSELDRAGLGGRTRVFILSDTRGDAAVEREERALGPLIASGAVTYRRRAINAGLKPGNIADWLDRWGDGFDYMVVLDADSRMSADRIRRLVCAMEGRPRLGLLQAGIALSPARTRFGRHQRTAARLLGPTFVRGFAAWSGRTANYWGHNALVRIEAFRPAARLPVLPGRAPFGGPVMSHDFVEAAWMRRAGWEVELDVEQGGSAEDAPQTLEEFHRRDRRWCQGNLQHLRLLAEPGLHPLSRFHMASGVFSYLAAPVWLALLLMTSSGAVVIGSVMPVLLVGLLLLVPKVCGLVSRIGDRATPRRIVVHLRAALAELTLSAVLAPVMMVRQSCAVLLVLLGRDAGWKSDRPSRVLPRGTLECVAGVGLAGLAVAAGTSAALWLAPVVLSLVGAPLLIRYLDRDPDAPA